MVIVLSGVRLPFPRATTKVAQPVIGWSSVGSWVAPKIPVALGTEPSRSRFLEPGMLVGGVIGNIVQDEFHVPPLELCGQFIEFGQRAEHRMDVCVVRDVVA